MSHLQGLASADRISMMSGSSHRPSLAPSLMLHDYNGKKHKIIQTCRQIDDMRSGVVKSNVFQNLLDCMEVDVERGEFAECLKLHGVLFEGSRYIKYEAAVRMLSYDNHTESWHLRKQQDDLETLSVIHERKRNKTGLNRMSLRASCEGLSLKQRDEPMRSSLI
mmetsp:Transcript_1651/g.2287  ORF Transcript_1651/g.2287 Transcript_1651/m.2287 type:complete len:164 (+) Transcript_1651:104-595(+)